MHDLPGWAKWTGLAVALFAASIAAFLAAREPAMNSAAVVLEVVGWALLLACVASLVAVVRATPLWSRVRARAGTMVRVEVAEPPKAARLLERSGRWMATFPKVIVTNAGTDSAEVRLRLFVGGLSGWDPAFIPPFESPGIWVRDHGRSLPPIIHLQPGEAVSGKVQFRVPFSDPSEKETFFRLVVVAPAAEQTVEEWTVPLTVKTPPAALPAATAPAPPRPSSPGKARTSTAEAIREPTKEPVLRLSTEVVELPYKSRPDDPTPGITRLDLARAGPRFGVVRVENRSGRDIPSLIARISVEDEPWKGYGAWAGDPVEELVPVRLDEGPQLRAGAERLLLLAVIYPGRPESDGQTWYAVREPYSHVDYFNPDLVIHYGTRLGTLVNFRVLFEAEGLRQEVGFRLASNASGPVAKPPLGS